jgi:hypothetical protein
MRCICFFFCCRRHIDFGFVLNSAPPIDGPPFALYPAFESALRSVNAWDMFEDMCVDAFIAIRRLSPTVIRLAVMLFTKFGFDSDVIREVLSGKLSLNTHEEHEQVAAAFVRNQVRHSSTAWKTKFKAYSHSTIDPAFYSLLERRFPPAVLAMKIVDAKQQISSRKLEDSTSRVENDDTARGGVVKL